MELIELISRKFGIDCIKSVLNILHVLYSWQRSTTVRLLVPLEDLILVKSRLTCLADFKMVWWVWYHQSQVKLWCVDTSGIIFPFYWETKQHEDEAWPQKLSSPFTELGIQPSLLKPSSNFRPVLHWLTDRGTNSWCFVELTSLLHKRRLIY